MPVEHTLDGEFKQGLSPSETRLGKMYWLYGFKDLIKNPELYD